MRQQGQTLGCRSCHHAPSMPGPLPKPGQLQEPRAPSRARRPASPHIMATKPAGKEGEMRILELAGSRAPLSPKQAKWGVKTQLAAVSNFIYLSIDPFIFIYIYAFMPTYAHLKAQLQLCSGSKPHTTRKSAVSGGYGWAVFISNPPLTAPRAQTPLQGLDSSRAPCWTPGQAGPAPPAWCRSCHLALAASGYGVL